VVFVSGLSGGLPDFRDRVRSDAHGPRGEHHSEGVENLLPKG